MAEKDKKKKKLPPIKEEFVGKMEASLTVLRDEIVEKLKASSNEFRNMAEGMDSKDEIDMASDDLDRKMFEAIGAQEMKKLKLIDSALTRIKQGKYGHCIKCSRRIPQERLTAIPYALMCVECKTEEERRNR